MRKVLTLVLAGLWVVGIAWFFGWQSVGPPAYTCSLPDAQICTDTFDRSTDWYLLTGRPSAIEVSTAPGEWAESVDPGFRAADWSARIERLLLPPILGACYYSSEPVVTCHAEERAFTPPDD